MISYILVGILFFILGGVSGFLVGMWFTLRKLMKPQGHLGGGSIKGWSRRSE